MVPEIITGQRRSPGVEELFDGEQRRLGVQRIEDRFDEQDVGTAIGQAADGFDVAGDQFVEVTLR